MILSTQAPDSTSTWLPILVPVAFVAFSVLGVLMMRLIGSRFTARILPEFPARQIAFDAQWRTPGQITLGGSSGNAYRFAMDADYLHIVPMLPMRVLFGMTARSVPWSEIEVSRIDGDQATALFGGHAFIGPAWSVERAQKSRVEG